MQSDNPVTPLPPSQRGDLDLVMQAVALIHTGFANADQEVFARDFVFYFFNPQLEELRGDYPGYDGSSSLFERLRQGSDSGFHKEPHSLTPYGHELGIAHATNAVSFGGTAPARLIWMSSCASPGPSTAVSENTNSRGATSLGSPARRPKGKHEPR